MSSTSDSNGATDVFAIIKLHQRMQGSDRTHSTHAPPRRFAWVAGSLFVAFGPAFAPTLLGKVFACAQAAMVFLLAELHFVALGRPRLAA